jgi:hypothetical protein
MIIRPKQHRALTSHIILLIYGLAPVTTQFSLRSSFSKIALIVFGLLFALDAKAGEISCAANWWRTLEPYNMTRIEGLWPSGRFPRPAACQAAFFQGAIVKGDFDRVVQFISEHHPFLHQLLISSPGGDVDEAMRIGRLVKRYLLYVQAPGEITGGKRNLSLFTNSRPFENAYTSKYLCKEDDGTCLCASSCALIWFAARERGGIIGLHRLRAADQSAFGAAPPDVASKWYSDRSTELKKYLQEMEVPQSTLEAIFAVSSGQIAWLDYADEEHPPSFAEWIDAACGYQSDEEWQTLIKLRLESGVAFGGRNKLGQIDRLLLEKLEERFAARNNCRAKQKFNTLDAMPPPVEITSQPR